MMTATVTVSVYPRMDVYQYTLRGAQRRTLGDKQSYFARSTVSKEQILEVLKEKLYPLLSRLNQSEVGNRTLYIKDVAGMLERAIKGKSLKPNSLQSFAPNPDKQIDADVL